MIYQLAPLALALAPVVAAQQPSSRPTWPSQERVHEVLEYLASDEMAGRNTPSPELERAADQIAVWFKKAGLEPLKVKGAEARSYFHRYTQAAQRFDTTGLSVTLHHRDGSGRATSGSRGRRPRASLRAVEETPRFAARVPHR